jgi:uncharacterized protein (DUF433 family)
MSVAHVVNLLANGMSSAEILAELPDLDAEDIRQARLYCADLARNGHAPRAR